MLIALNFLKKDSKYLLSVKCLKQKIKGKPLKLLVEMMAKNLPESEDCGP